jgi:hypothetical protein
MVNAVLLPASLLFMTPSFGLTSWHKPERNDGKQAWSKPRARSSLVPDRLQACQVLSVLPLVAPASGKPSLPLRQNASLWMQLERRPCRTLRSGAGALKRGARRVWRSTAIRATSSHWFRLVETALTRASGVWLCGHA